MITRYYICDSCGHELTHRQELHDEKRLKKCPECGKHKLYQDLSGQHTFIYGEPQNLGHLAARNSERAGKYELESIHREQKISREKVQVENLKKAGVLPQNAEELPSSKTLINPEGENLKKKLKPILEEPNAKVRKEKIKKYIEKGI